ncbi:DUF2750 domain-containing protein [Shewanella sp. NIFS-20-20]|uniref:DUF2750 domain-containing protein n=1 Tax=Shewanella sp. NIFS-20-20 TaxID=2853806 RepID=UPI001C43DEB5|nr:DUF2750 domain-containing protein [Shewanella sp. NIFS-20-20]MBV7314328.1 DUF2750 domain-containing protein [Shewanella sp. NIFS-20-20]
MSELDPVLSSFIANVKEQQMLWGLQDETGEGWVVCDSADYEETDAMPLWSTEAMAKTHCTDEWADYQAVAIPLSEYLEFWVSDLNDDGVVIGIDWQNDQGCLELDPIELAKHLVDVEALQQ